MTQPSENSITTSNNQKIKKCEHCNTDFPYKKSSRRFCCLRCQYLAKRAETFVPEEGMIECQICKLQSHDLCGHITRIHKMTIFDYSIKYNNAPTRSKTYLGKASERIKGDKNPGWKHGGKFSALSDKFIHADTTNKQDVIDKIAKSQQNGNNSTTLLYWTKQGYTEEEARKKISERQTTFSLEKCIEKYGEEKGRERWKARQEKWLSNYKKSNFSKISQKLFWEIYNQLPNKQNIYFATLKDTILDESGCNNEYNLSLKEKVFKPDFVNIVTKKIIEFDGDYWHRATPTNTKRDQLKDEYLKQEGFDVLHIFEKDYKENPELTVKNCIEFLNGTIC